MWGDRLFWGRFWLDKLEGIIWDQNFENDFFIIKTTINF